MAAVTRVDARTARSTTGWYADLEQGAGAAAAVDTALRAVLLDATADAAEEQGRRELAHRAEQERAAKEAERQRELARKERERAAAEQARRDAMQRRKDAAARRSPRDRRILLWAFGLSVTVLVPWLIGLFVLRLALGSTVQLPLPTDVVMELRWHQLGSYFLTDWLSGCAAIFFVAAACVLIGPWRHREGVVVWGIVFVAVAAVVLVPGAVAQRTTADRDLRNVAEDTSYPFDDHYYTCGGVQAGVVDSQQFGRDVQFWTARREGTDGGCNRIEMWNGWNRIAAYDLPKNATVSTEAVENGVGVYSRSSLATTGAVAVTSDGYLTGARAQAPTKWWRVKLRQASDVRLAMGSERAVLVGMSSGEHPYGAIRSAVTGKLLRRLCQGKGGFGDGQFDEPTLTFHWSCSDGQHSVREDAL